MELQDNDLLQQKGVLFAKKGGIILQKNKKQKIPPFSSLYE